MSELHLGSLEIKNFRCFEHLTIEKLGRVNLIVGKNSSGKTSLLEAVNVYANGALPHQLLLMFFARGDANPQKVEKVITAEQIASLFYGWSAKISQDTLEIGEKNNDKNRISVQVIYCVDDTEAPPRLKEIDSTIAAQADGVKLGLKIKQGEKYNRIFGLPASGLPDFHAALSRQSVYTCTFIPSDGLGAGFIPLYWDTIVLQGREQEVIDLLKIVDPEIERIYMLSADSPFGRVPFVKTRRTSKPFQLRNHGEGAVRILGVALSLLMTKNGFLLIDEFENGLHHSIQAKVWQAIFFMAKEASIQVFATTHSWDCVEAFQEASAEIEDEEAMLISLQQRKAGIKAVLLNKRDLKVATRGHIEVR